MDCCGKLNKKSDNEIHAKKSKSWIYWIALLIIISLLVKYLV